MSFDLVAKKLLTGTTPAESTPKAENEILSALEAQGFDNAGLIKEYRDLLDQTDDEAIKVRVLSDIAKISGAMRPDTTNRAIPNITINVFGDNVRVAQMLCPSE